MRIKTIFSDPVLFHAVGMAWPLSKVCVCLGLFLMLMGVLMVWPLARHTKAHWRRLNSTEAAEVAFHAVTAPGESFPARTIAGWGVVGAEINLNIDIDGFRRAWRTGDWITFFLWPISMSCCLIGMWLVFTAFLIYMPPACWVLVSIVFLGIEGNVLFTPIAAIFTNIDAGADTPAVQSQPKK